MPLYWPSVFARPWFQISLLFLIGLQAFFSNITLSLFGETEGLYAIVTHTMMAGGDYIHLWLRGEPYFNKPPLFFWLQAGFVKAFDWSELALRLPSALASMGTMFTTYALGKLWFSHSAAFWAALVVGTCYAGLWFGPLAIIDPVLTFFMTVGLYGLARAYFQEQASGWYVVGFVALALGAMVKTLHALALPAMVLGLFLYVRRDTRPFRTQEFWVGVVMAGMLLAAYFSLLGQDFWDHFFLKENLNRLVAQVGDEEHSALEAYWGKRPIHWYAYAIWFDLFPWSVVMPFGFWLLWTRRPWKQFPQELWLLLWVVGYFVAFSLAPEKHERYLLPLLPGLGLMVGYVYHSLTFDQRLEQYAKVLRAFLGLAGLAFVVLAFLGPYLLQKKWYVGLDIIPLGIQGALTVLGVCIMAWAFLGQWKKALKGIGILGFALMLTVSEFIIPGILNAGSPAAVYRHAQQALTHPSDPILVFQSWDWRGDEDEFYWDSWHGHSRIVAENQPQELAIKQLVQEVSRAQTLTILMTEDQLQLVRRDASELHAEVLMHFYRSKKRIVLVALNGNGRPG